MSYHHFTVDERKSILIYHMQGLNFSQLLSYFIVIRKVMSKIEGEFLFLIPFMKDPKKQTSELGSVLGKQIQLQVKLEKLV